MAVKTARVVTYEQLQRQMAYDRLLERLYLVDEGWIIKGATALLALRLASGGLSTLTSTATWLGRLPRQTCVGRPPWTSATGSASRSALDGRSPNPAASASP